MFYIYLGLDFKIKKNFGLWVSGVLGHQWDMVYRYFNATSTINIERELAIIRKKFEDCELCKHYGSIYIKLYLWF